MPNQPQQPLSPGGLLRWAMTPPQAYVVYLICVVLIGGVSFYVGTLRPKAHPGLAPPQAAMVPQSK